MIVYQLYMLTISNSYIMLYKLYDYNYNSSKKK